MGNQGLIAHYRVSKKPPSISLTSALKFLDISVIYSGGRAVLFFNLCPLQVFHTFQVLKRVKIATKTAAAARMVFDIDSLS